MAAKIAIALVAGLYFFSRGWTLLAEDGRGWHGSRPWFMGALSSVILVPALLVVWCRTLVFRNDDSATVHEDRLEHPRWKKPVYFRDIDAVKYEKGRSGFEWKGSVHLRLKDGSTQHLPASLVTDSPSAFQRKLKSALERYRAGPLPLS